MTADTAIRVDLEMMTRGVHKNDVEYVVSGMVVPGTVVLMLSSVTGLALSKDGRHLEWSCKCRLARLRSNSFSVS